MSDINLMYGRPIKVSQQAESTAMNDTPESELVSRLNVTAATEGPWCYGPVECLECGAKWIGVWPLGADNLECACGSTDTVREQ